ncbi:hypothetical protein F9L33_14590 [Amylibacter sp. SFDW26]|uniref:hypothetical protein n=1 Tax=Amylibacter sp. SFDW26 TaxID=2652722 RepID=UPI001261A94F|nr:hypothetical protein [Amylibacter sp. SFDW26]KAB7610121.1 hypothetical protein F9L33_14590 [Amylibacter sp. SFDW26]
MFVLILRTLGWLGLLSGAFNISIKLFGSEQAVREYAGASRNLDAAILMIAICIIFLALASIMAKLEGD